MRLGTTELILILIIAIALFGTSRIAGIGKAMGKSIREFKEELNPDDSDEKKEEAGRTHEEL
ncbi:MAG: twin-arginine translocase TatA/TatE family subunit [Eubacteriales bacterium]|nr:twin-arginine translocase TatA/TatE family subunit [Sarcina sp.]MBR2729491.1 twin-arginine translocase TatA/TatE family subunit [Lachnospiraceae bacterium]MDO4417571.1 twin-arginine translocase TatA/TatE family subunit [Eubacteriales bacterium]